MPVNDGRSPGRPARWAGIALAPLPAAATASVQIGPAIAADNPYQRGPEPTRTGVAASRGAFATAQVRIVVIGIDTNSPNDFDFARGRQPLAALGYLTRRSSVRDRVATLLPAGQDGTRVTITSCAGGGGQKWVFNANGTITTPQSGRCLDVDARATADNTAVAMSNQVWTRRA
ncbi:RICIN domain-containing protein [Actinosynnema sp. NPDC023794]